MALKGRTVRMANLTCEEKDMVASVSAFFEKEKCLGEAINVKDVVSRTAEACAVSEATVVRCQRHSDTTTFPLEKSHLSEPKLEDPESM